MNSLKKNYVLNLAYQLLVIVLPIVTTPYVSRVLQVENIGDISYTTSIATYFGVLGLLGSSVYGQLRVAKERDNKYLVSKTFFEIVSCRILSMTLSIALYCIMMIFVSEKMSFYIILFIYLFAQMIDISWFFQGLENFKVIITKNCFIKIIALILIYSVVKRREDVMLYMMILNGSTFIGNLILWFSVKKYICYVRINQWDICNTFKQNIIFFIPSIEAVIFVSLDKCMIGWITKSSYENGFYEQANKIYSLVISFITSLSVVVLPRVTYLWADFEKNKVKIRETIDRTITFISLIVCPISVGLFCVSANLINVFLGRGYEGCIPVLKVFSFIIICTSFNSIISNQCIVARGNQVLYNKLLFISSCINVVCNIFLITILMARGAALASAISELILLALNLFLCRGILNFRYIMSNFFRYMLYAIIMGISIMIFDYFFDCDELYKLIIEIGIGVVVYGLQLLFSRDKFIYEYIIRDFFLKKKKV